MGSRITERQSRTRAALSKSAAAKTLSPPKEISKTQRNAKAISSSAPLSSTTPKRSLKRKRVDQEDDARSKVKSSSTDVKDYHVKQTQEEEKRLLRFRKHAPKSFLEKLERAQTQRMIVLGRTRSGSKPSLQEAIDVVGSTGNIYKVTIGQLPTCTCPDHQKGNECKHKVYVLHTVLKARADLQYQRAFLTSELEDIFSNAPPLPTETVDTGDHNGKRKPVEGECPICYMDLEEDNNELVWCKAACGNNIHKSCFDQWAASQRGNAVKCVYCRTDWQMNQSDLKAIQSLGTTTAEGYVNVADHFGMSRARDYSTYHQPWVRRTFGYGS